MVSKPGNEPVLYCHVMGGSPWPHAMMVGPLALRVGRWSVFLVKVLQMLIFPHNRSNLQPQIEIIEYCEWLTFPISKTKTSQKLSLPSRSRILFGFEENFETQKNHGYLLAKEPGRCRGF
ncbi:hypothetical protein DVH24_015005 [Malus domestica]|uniref:Uncharacterized protein n=1 Tax=Malus domestica TaxID=3750 RepID=A0A498K2H8_MALDO|nr:hypothetical protein DVH24_015005 [Malus domestica]